MSSGPPYKPDFYNQRCVILPIAPEKKKGNEWHERRGEKLSQFCAIPARRRSDVAPMKDADCGILIVCNEHV